MKITLKNERLSVEISDFGAEMTSLKLDGFEYLWCGDPKYFGRVSPILFPITGRFMDGYYTHDGIKYPMKLNGILMEKTFSINKISETEAVLSIKQDEETMSLYPWEFRLDMKYKLDGNKLYISYDIYNDSDSIMPYGIGNHTAYKWPLIDGDESSSYYLKFEQNETIESFSPFGWVRPFLTNERIRPIYHEFYENGTRSIRNYKSNYLEYTGSNCDYVLRMYSHEFPFLANWARPEKEANLVCLEPCVSISSHGPSIFDREGIRSLEPKKMETTSYYLELYKKSEK